MTEEIAREEIAAALRPHLQVAESRALGAFRVALSDAMILGLGWLHLEIFPDYFATGFPVMLYFLDSVGREVVLEGQTERDPTLLQSPGLLPWGFEDAWDAKYLDDDIDWMTIAGEVTLEWLVPLLEPEVPKLGRPRVTMCVHDDGRAFELATKSWVDYPPPGYFESFR